MFLLQTTFLHVLALGALAPNPRPSLHLVPEACANIAHGAQSADCSHREFTYCNSIVANGCRRHRGTELPLPLPRAAEAEANVY